MAPRRRRRVDWEEERRKTEQSQAKGFRYSALSFFMVFLFMLMIKVFHREYSLGVPMRVLGALLVGTVVLFILVHRRRGNRHGKSR